MLIKIWLQNLIKRIISGVIQRFSSGYVIFQKIEISHLAVITGFRLTSDFSGTSGYRKWSKPLPSQNFNLCLCPQKEFERISCLGRPWWTIDFTIEKTRQCIYFIPLSVPTLIFRNLNTIHRASKPTRPEKARRLGYKATQGFVVYRSHRLQIWVQSYVMWPGLDWSKELPIVLGDRQSNETVSWWICHFKFQVLLWRRKSETYEKNKEKY